MKVKITFEIYDEERVALAAQNRAGMIAQHSQDENAIRYLEANLPKGKPASRDTCKRFIQYVVHEAFSQAVFEQQNPAAKHDHTEP